MEMEMKKRRDGLCL